MSASPHTSRFVKVIGAAAVVAAVSYAGYAAVTWLRYGEGTRSAGDERDPLLDRFMPEYEVGERHHIAVAAPAAVTFSAARDQDLLQSGLVRAIFKAREVVLGGTDRTPHRRGLLADTLALGWGVLAETPERQIVVGCVTRPWEPNPVFQALPPDQFARFNDPGYVKIAWTLRADPVGDAASIFRTETRVSTTDPVARARFRRYWSLASPGIVLIRRLLLAPVKREAERRALEAAAVSRSR
jgi:hypothetical protein